MIITCVAFEGHKKAPGFVSAILTVICYASFFSSLTFISASISKASVVLSKPVDFVKENAASEQIVWGCDGDQYFKNSTNCEIIIVSDDMLKKVGYSTLPYLQVNRIETYEAITAFGKTFYDEPDIHDTYRFYVSKEYLDGSDLDWSLLFETEDS